MLLNQVDRYNDFTDEFRNELEAKVKALGKYVRYKFNISNTNPDPLKEQGKEIWPSRWTLDPVTFYITDPYEKRAGKQKLKFVGLIKEIDETGDKTKVKAFHRIRVLEGNKGVVQLDLEDNEQLAMAMLLEIHPKHQGGQFADKNKQQIFVRIDEKKLATDKRTERSAKAKALNAAQEMSDAQVGQFADAMMWDSSEELDVLRNRIEEMAETNPEFFNDLVKGKNVEYQAAVKRALDKKVVAFDPAEYKFIWESNKQTITILQPSQVKNEVEVMAEWLQTGGDKASEIYKKIVSLSK